MRVDLYADLGVSGEAGADEIRAAYLALMRRHHPDVNPGHEEAARRVNAAYAVLGDPRRRAAYDRRHGPRRPPLPAHATTPPTRAAYSQDRANVRATFLGATLRFTGAVLALGVVLLLALGAQ